MRLTLFFLLTTTVSLAQTSATPTQANSSRTPPTRQPNTSGYVEATTLPDDTVPTPTLDGNFILGPTHTPSPATVLSANTPHGTVTTFTLNSSESRIYPGIARTPGTSGTPDPADPAKLIVTTSHPAPYTRRVTVYVPAQLAPGKPAPILIGADGPEPDLYPILDNLIAAGRIPALVFISIANGSGDAQGSERGLEYDTMSPRYADFVEHEILPLVEARLRLTLSRDPAARATMGGSSGAACAFIMAWFHPQLYGRVLAYSGTWINQQWPTDPHYPHGAWEFPEHLIRDTPTKPIRIWMEVGDRDLLNPNAMRDGMHDWVLANENMAAALEQKGYHVQFVFAANAGHVDHAVKQQTLPEALEYLWQGYASPSR